MRRFGLREANQRFAQVIRAVRSGEEVLLVDRGTPLAVVKPIRKAAGALDRLAARGLVTLARKPATLEPFRPVRIRGGLSTAVIDERNERG